MQESTLLRYWSLLHPLGQCLLVALSLSLLALRFKFLSFSENLEKYLRSFALGAQAALLFWPIFASTILRGRVDLSLWFIIPILWMLGVLAHFSLATFTKIKIPLRDGALSCILVLFFIPWLPIAGAPTQSATLLWIISLCVMLLASEISGPRFLLGIPLFSFVMSLLGFFFPGLIPLFISFFIGVWSYGLFRETLVLFGFFPEGNKRFIPALIAFTLTLAASLAWA